VFGFVGDVAGKFAEAERELSTEVEKGADKDEDAAEDEEHTAYFAEVHEGSLDWETELRKYRFKVSAGGSPSRTNRLKSIPPALSDGGDAAEEVGLFGDGFCADGEGVEKIQTEGEFEGFVLAIAQSALAENFHADNSLPSGFHFF